MTISFKDFILSGRFGPVYIGMPIDELKQLFGEPGDSHDSGAGTALLFYEGFEFYYYTETNTLYAIQNDNVQYEHPDAKGNVFQFRGDIQIDTWFIQFGEPLSYQQVLEHLRAENIPFEEHHKSDYDELKFPSGVTMDFENWKDDEGKVILERNEASLNGIRYFVS